MFDIAMSFFALFSSIILMLGFLKSSKYNSSKLLISANAITWSAVFLLYYLGEVLIFKNKFPNLGNLNYIYIVSLVGSLLVTLVPTNVYSRREFLPDLRAKNASLFYLSVISICVACLYNVYVFAGMNIIDFFSSSSSIRIEKFKYSYEGAPLLYSLVEYVGYIYVPALFIIVLKAKNKSDIFYIVSIGLLALLLGLFNFSRTPVVIYISIILPTLFFNPFLISKIKKVFSVRNILLIALLLSSANFISLSRDNGAETSFNIIKSRYNLKIQNNQFNIAIVSNYLYIYTSMNNLKDKYNSTSLAENYGYGLNTFGPLITFIRKLGIDFSIQENIFDTSGETNSYIFGYNATYNASTGYLSFIKDYGKVLGLILPTLLMLLVTLSSYLKSTYYRVYLYVVACGWMLNSPFVNYFQTAGKAIIVGLVVIYIVEKRKTDAQ